VPKADISLTNLRARYSGPLIILGKLGTARSGDPGGVVKHSNVVIALCFALVFALPAVSAQAQNQHSFVSSLGNDANACTLTAPCRHLQAALTATIAGGEIAILDTAGYNGGATVTITRAVSIVNPGGFEAAIAPPSGGVGIIINAGTNDAVSLRGLSIDGGGVGATGIVFNTGASLTIENCIVRHMVNDGIDFLSSTATSALTVSNTLVADNGAAGIYLTPNGSATAVFNRVEANNNGGHGIVVYGVNSANTNTINATVSDSIAAGNGSAGFFTTTDSSHAPTNVMVFHSVAANNGTGVFANGSGGTLRVANSTVTGNTNGWLALSSGVVASYDDNYIDGNGSNTGSLTPISKQ